VSETPPLLRVRDLKTYFVTEHGSGTARAVDGVSFDVQPGETLGIVGESGCGKTVTSLSILRLIPEPPGHIRPGSFIEFEGRNILTLEPRELRAVRGNQIAMIFQEPMTSLNPVFTVGDQIAEAAIVHQHVTRAAARRRAIEMLQLVGIPDPAERVDHYPHQMSGGMRQRVMIAMALVCHPKLLIADEPTTALDVTIQAQILELLERLQAELGMAVMLITHDLGVVAGTADRVVVMYAGQVVEQAPTPELFARPAHPYTEGLLASVPRLDAPRPTAGGGGGTRGRLHSIPGQVPAATAWPDGCRFHPRCPYAWDRCRAEEPPLLDADQGREPGTHTARCWLVAEPQRRATRP
jgi:oligopeptide/dipeptide ABC transporter ATP-binding protein